MEAASGIEPLCRALQALASQDNVPCLCPHRYNKAPRFQAAAMFALGFIPINDPFSAPEM
jgi:hypothetical protein